MYDTAAVTVTATDNVALLPEVQGSCNIAEVNRPFVLQALVYATQADPQALLGVS
jgi:hypothetical protein